MKTAITAIATSSIREAAEVEAGARPPPSAAPAARPNNPAADVLGRGDDDDDDLGLAGLGINLSDDPKPAVSALPSAPAPAFNEGYDPYADGHDAPANFNVSREALQAGLRATTEQAMLAVTEQAGIDAALKLALSKDEVIKVLKKAIRQEALNVKLELLIEKLIPEAVKDHMASGILLSKPGQGADDYTRNQYRKKEENAEKLLGMKVSDQALPKLEEALQGDGVDRRAVQVVVEKALDKAPVLQAIQTAVQRIYHMALEAPSLDAIVVAALKAGYESVSGKAIQGPLPLFNGRDGMGREEDEEVPGSATGRRRAGVVDSRGAPYRNSPKKLQSPAKRGAAAAGSKGPANMDEAATTAVRKAMRNSLDHAMERALHRSATAYVVQVLNELIGDALKSALVKAVAAVKKFHDERLTEIDKAIKKDKLDESKKDEVAVAEGAFNQEKSSYGLIVMQVGNPSMQVVDALARMCS